MSTLQDPTVDAQVTGVSLDPVIRGGPAMIVSVPYPSAVEIE
jgi:hypothetical protein